jgi:CHAT domain-containing protein/tetratricopeptide (TPR) repeat protein
MPNPSPSAAGGNPVGSAPPAEVLRRAFQAVREKSLSLEQYLRLAGSRELALRATPESTTRLCAALREAAGLEAEALPLARAAERHASSLDDLGLSQAALALYDALMPIVERHGSEHLRATCLINQGVACDHLQRHADAAVAYDRAIAILLRLVEGGRLDLRGTLTRALMNRGNALAEQGKPAEAVGAYDQAITLLLRLVVEEDSDEHCNDLARALVNKSNALRQQGKREEAVRECDLAIILLRRLVEEEGRLDLRNDLAGTFLNKGVALAELGKLAEAVLEYDRAIAIRQTLVSEGRSELRHDLAKVLLNKGHALRQQGQLAEAAAVLGQLSPQLFRGDDRRRYHQSLANLLWEQGRREEALEQFAQARRVLHQARRTAGIDETSLEYVAEREGFITRAVNCALELDRNEEAFAAVQDGKATVFGDLYSRKEGPCEKEADEVLAARARLVSYLRNPPERCASGGGDAPGSPGERLAVWQAEVSRHTEAYLRQWRLARYLAERDRPPAAVEQETIDLAAIQAALPPRWALLDFWQTQAEEITVFLVTRETLTVHTLTFPLRKLSRKLDALWRLIQAPMDRDRNDEALADLHAYLFLPLLRLLRQHGIAGLYLVPHGLLHALPLHAARSGTGYLCEEFDIAYLPSASLLPQLPAVQPFGPVFSLANPERGTKHSLPFSEWEGYQLEQRYGHGEPGAPATPGSIFRRGADATYESTSHWGHAGLVHFSCHGLGHAHFAPLSHLRLADDLLLAHDVVHRRPALRDGALVVLGGCQTAVRDIRAFNESMGLMTAFLLRGASLVFATQWSVVDGCAAEMVLAFLAEMIDRKSPPTIALRKARQQVRRMTLDDLLHRWQDVESILGEDESAERGKLQAQIAWLCRRAGRVGAAKHFAEQAVVGLRQAGLGDQADQLLAMTRDGSAGETEMESFDHPIFWGAFQLVGRVT